MVEGERQGEVQGAGRSRKGNGEGKGRRRREKEKGEGKVNGCCQSPGLTDLYLKAYCNYNPEKKGVCLY